MNPSSGDPLAGLRGYHLPAEVAWWPPAPGWWLLAALITALLVAGVWWLSRRKRRRAVARTALRELTQLRETLAVNHDADAFVRGLSRLLRRFALFRFPRQQVAGLAGSEWLAFLDVHGGAGRFANGPGKILGDAPYRRGMQVQAEALSTLAEEWIRHNREARE